MAGRKHEFIKGLVIKRMREYGCKVMYVDGRAIGAGGETRVPPRFIHHRPDVVGITPAGQVCIGDAKTANDIRSARTRQQLQDFATLELNGLPCELFLGVPRNARARLAATLRELGVDDWPNVHVLSVPEELINE